MTLSLEQIIKSRRSIRKYNSHPVDPGDVASLVESALYAPSGSNLQLLHFIFVQDQVTIDLLKLFSPGLSKSAHSLIAICVDMEEAYTRGGVLGREVLAPMDTAFAAQNLLLAAHEIGLGTCVIKSYNHDSVKKILELPGELSPQLLISIGYYDKSPDTPARDSYRERLHFEKW